MPNLIQSFRGWLRRRLRPPAAVSLSEAERADLTRKVLQQIEATEDIELSCDEVFALMDMCAEAAVRGENIARLMPLVQRHLEMCPDCREEFEALVRTLKSAPA